MREKCKEAFIKNWENEINFISDNSKNSKEFWRKIKLLKGKKAVHTNYMKDNDGNKHFSDREKCNVMEKTWKDLFRTREDEDNNFDKDHSEHIESYIKVNNNRVKTYPTADFNRVNAEIYCTR